VPKENVHISKFTVGEFSAAGLARVDLEITPLAAETQENIFPQSVGSGIVRPGTQYLGTTASSVIRLMPFVRSVDDVAMLELSDGMLRVWVDDALVTRPQVECLIVNTRFEYDGTWTKSATSGAYVTIAANVLTLEPRARGSECWAQQTVTTESLNVEHAVRIVVDRGPVNLRIGYTAGGEQYLEETSLGHGVHSLAFTPTFNTFYIRFTTRLQRKAIISQCSIEKEGIMEIDAPWAESYLKGFRYDQSADVMFLANRNVQPLKIERRGDHSWSVVYYEPDDGPFQSPPVSGVAVQPSATYGEVTLTADRDVFDSNMIGSLVRVFHERMDATWELAGNNTYTDVFQIRGVKAKNFNDRQFSYQVTGSWSGTLIVQRSITGESGDFLDYNRDDGTSAKYINSNISVTHKGEEEDDNVIGYMRIGFVEGQYTSGTATVSVQYEGDSGYGIGRITGVASGTSCTVEVIEPFNATSRTASWSIGSWSAYNGWPSAVALYDGRIWWGSLDEIWGSGSDDFYGFDDLKSGDSATISRQIATGGQVSRISWMMPLQRLLVGTSGSEVSIRSSSLDRPLTPTNITLKDASTFGSANVSPVRKDSKGIFVHRSGKKVMATGFSFDDKDYRSGDLTELNEDICGTGITELAIQREPETYVWCVREDGKCAILIYDDEDPDNKVQGWSKFVTDGRVDSVCVLPGEGEDNVYLAIDRSDPDEANAYEPGENATNAEILADGRSPVAAFDFIDQSVWVRDPNNPEGYDYDGVGTLGAEGTSDYGKSLGPDLFFQTWSGWAFELPIMCYTRQADGRYCLPYHNHMHKSEDFRHYYWQQQFVGRNISFWYYGLYFNTNTSSFSGTATVDVQHHVETSPRGDETATRLVPTTDNSQHYMTHFYLSGGYVDSFETSYNIWPEYFECIENWISIFVKADGYNKCQIFFFGGLNSNLPLASSGRNASWLDDGSITPIHRYIFDFDFTTGALTINEQYQYYANATQATTFYLHDYYAVQKDNGWWRLFFNFTDMNADCEWGIRLQDNDGNTTFSGDGTSGILVWGAQEHEAGTPDNDFYYHTEDNKYDTFYQARIAHFGLPYEWDSSGNPLGLRIDVNCQQVSSQMQRMRGGTVLAGTVNTNSIYNGDYRDRRTYAARIYNGTVPWEPTVADPSGAYRTGKLVDGPTGIVTVSSGSYTGGQRNRDWYSNSVQPDTGFNTHALFVKYSGSAKYVTLSQTNTTPSTQDAWYSCTWDIETGTLTEEYYQPGSGAGWTDATDGFIERTNGIETYANEWYRVWVHARSDVSGGQVYWAFSDSPTPGSNTNGLYPTSSGSPSGKHFYVWAPYHEGGFSLKDAGPGPISGWYKDQDQDPSWETLMLTEDVRATNPDDVLGPSIPYEWAHKTRRKIPWNRPDSATDMRQCFTMEATYNIRGWGADLYGASAGDVDEEYHDGWESAPNTMGLIWEYNYADPITEYDGYFSQKVAFTIDPHTGLCNGFGQWRWPYEIGYPSEDFSPTQQILEGNPVTLNTPTTLKLVYNGSKKKLSFYQDGVFKSSGQFEHHFDENLSEGDLWESLRYTDSELMWRPHWSYYSKLLGGAAPSYLRQLCLTGVCSNDGERYIEKLAHQSEAVGGTHNKMADSFIYEAGPASSVFLSHIGSRDVVAWGTKDGVPYALYGLTSDGGYVDLGDTYTDIYCGIGYQGLYKSAKLAYAAQGGTALTMPKRVSELGLLLENAHVNAVEFGPDFNTMRRMDRIYSGRPLTQQEILEVHDQIAFSFPGEWNTDSRVCLRIQAPYPATLLGLVTSVELNERNYRRPRR